MARDYGGAHGGQPWHGAQPPFPGQPYPGQPRPAQPYSGQPYPDQPYSDQPYLGTPYQGEPGNPMPRFVPFPDPGAGSGAGPTPTARRRRAWLVAVALLVVGAVGFLAAVAGLASQAMPRRFTASQQQQITNWELGKRWRTLPASVIFPASVSYPPPGSLGDDPSLTLSAQRVGIASQASCAAATDPTAAGVLDHDGCTAMLRATYVDQTGSYVLTVGAAVLPSATQATAAAKAIAADAGSDGLGSTVHTVPFAGTLAASFSNKRRQVSGVLAAGTYVILYAVGYADSRPREPVAGDKYAYGEMTNSGSEVAHAVQSVLAASVPAPRCPGAPGC